MLLTWLSLCFNTFHIDGMFNRHVSFHINKIPSCFYLTHTIKCNVFLVASLELGLLYIYHVLYILRKTMKKSDIPSLSLWKHKFSTSLGQAFSVTYTLYRHFMTRTDPQYEHDGAGTRYVKQCGLASQEAVTMTTFIHAQYNSISMESRKSQNHQHGSSSVSVWKATNPALKHKERHDSFSQKPYPYLWPNCSEKVHCECTLYSGQCENASFRGFVNVLHVVQLKSLLIDR